MERERSYRRAFAPLRAFLHTEAASGSLLLVCALAALIWANLAPASYGTLFELRVELPRATGFTLRGFINEGLMTVFFFVVGMEIKRELRLGELSTRAAAALPAIAAIGGMLVPAAIFVAFNPDATAQRGWGIPMATDIAFCVGILSLLGARVPRGLTVFVTALAIFDDIGGILVIALFYGHGLHAAWLLAAGLVTLVLFALNRSHSERAFSYGALGVLLWSTFHYAGIHATMAGVVLGLMIPARGANALERWIRALHPVVAFAIMPLFALANSGVVIELRSSQLRGAVTSGTALGLLLGKPLGIFSFTMLTVRLGLARMPGGASALLLLGAAVAAGVGFTVALFIAALAYDSAPALLAQAKLGVLLGSFGAGLAGYAIMRAASQVPSRG